MSHPGGVPRCSNFNGLFCPTDLKVHFEDKEETSDLSTADALPVNKFSRGGRCAKPSDISLPCSDCDALGPF